MKHRLSVRVGALVTTIGLLAAGAVAASPAIAAPTAEISVQPAVYHPGSWGSGITVSGSGFAPSSTVTLDVSYNLSVPLGTATTTTDATGAFEDFTFTPATPAFTAGVNDNHFVTATDEAGASATAALDVRWPPTIMASVGELPTAWLVDPSRGIAFTLHGFDDDELVTVSASYNGVDVLGLEDLRAGTRGILSTAQYHLAEGVATAGTITFTFTGATSGLVLTADVRIVGADASASAGGTTLRFATSATSTAPTPPASASAEPAAAVRLPIVAG